MAFFFKLKEAEFVFGCVSFLFASVLPLASQSNKWRMNWKWCAFVYEYCWNEVQYKHNKKKKKKIWRINFWIAYVRVVLICFVPLRFIFFFVVVFVSLSLLLCHMVVFVSFVGIQITTIFNTIPKLECFWYVYLVVLSCVLKRKSSIFRFVVIGIVNGGL